MKFIRTALDGKASNQSLVRMLDDRLKGYEAARNIATIHISDLSDGFCPREFALLDVTKKQAKGQFVSSALRVAFDNGHALSDLCRNKWLEEDVVGDWRCLYCKMTVSFSKKPKVACLKCGAKLWTYQEYTLVNPTTGVSGSIDFFIDFGLGKHTAIECKSMAKDMFNDLKAPLAEHRIRTQLYLYHMATQPGTHVGKVDVQRAKVLYISKGFGQKTVEFGKVVPFKEFDVERDDKAVQHLYDRADAIALFRKKVGPMPQGICSNSFDKRVKSCSVPAECWGGKFPAGV